MVNLTKRYIEQLAKPEVGKQDFYWDSNPVEMCIRDRAKTLPKLEQLINAVKTA